MLIISMGVTTMVSAGRYRMGLTSEDAHSCIAGGEDGEQGEVAGQLSSSVAGANEQLQSGTYDDEREVVQHGAGTGPLSFIRLLYFCILPYP